MANPFKENSKPKVTPGGGKPEPTIEEPKVVVEDSTAPATESPLVGKDFLAKFVEPKSDGKTYSVYLSAEAGRKLEKLAKQLKCSKSKALDILLKNAVE